MGEGKSSGQSWEQVHLLIRSDIFNAAKKEQLDLSAECNKALAQRLGIKYQIPKPHPSSPPSKVIVAPDGSPAPARVISVTPVINAEDPTVAEKVLKERKERTAVKEPVKLPDDNIKRQNNTSNAIANAQTSLAPKKKGKKTDYIQKFVRARISREPEEGPDAIIAKDELYQLFERWCRDQDYSAVPDRRVFSVALKNKYAFAERIIGGNPSWVGIKVK